MNSFSYSLIVQPFSFCEFITVMEAAFDLLCSRQSFSMEQLPMLLEQTLTSVSTSLGNEKVAASLNELIFDNVCGFLFDAGG